MKKILLIEDEAGVVNFINRGLSEASYEVTVAFNGSSGLQFALDSTFDLIILDIMLPDINGIEVCRNIRTRLQHTPILMLTALGTSENIANGLNNGADDYLVKPFKFIELLARMNALLRRSSGVSNLPLTEKNIYSLADLLVDDDAKTVQRSGKPIQLTATEYRLLLVLLKNKGKVLSRLELLESAWNINFNLGTNVVDVYINYLRKKIDADEKLKLIHTIVGMGYVMKST